MYYSCVRNCDLHVKLMSCYTLVEFDSYSYSTKSTRTMMNISVPNTLPLINLILAKLIIRLKKQKEDIIFIFIIQFSMAKITCRF